MIGKWRHGKNARKEKIEDDIKDDLGKKSLLYFMQNENRNACCFRFAELEVSYINIEQIKYFLIDLFTLKTNILLMNLTFL